MDVILIEDDEFKAQDVLKTLEDASIGSVVKRAMSVTVALRLISEQDYRLCLLDMSLPTFDLSGPGGGGSPQGQGGIEVLRLAGRRSLRCPFVIVTQYPDVELGGREIPIDVAAPILSKRFSVTVAGCVHYSFDSEGWKSPLVRLVKSVLS